MKKKIVYISLTAAITIAAFFIGRNTASEPETISPQKNFQIYNEVAANIVDWNTNGEELA